LKNKQTPEHKKYLEELGAKYAKKLIINKTKWESILHKHITELGYSFKFQIPIVLKIPKDYKLYILDFLIPKYNLIIEVDGLSTHSTKEQVKKDNLRTKRLVKEGYTILRFWNKQIDTLTKDQISDIISHRIIKEC
jgi:very-short-patch-repair endonuclease